MIKKVIKIGVYLAAVVVVIYVLLVPDLTLPLRLRIESIYFTNKYKSELKMTKSYLKTIATGDHKKVKQILYDDFYFTERPTLLDCLHKVLQNRDIESLNILLLERHIRDNLKLMHIVTFLDNDLKSFLIISYKEHEGTWLIEGISLSDKLQHDAESLCN